jgi:predicted alpha/beta hydrolase family esterase
MPNLDPCRAVRPDLHVLTLPGWQGSGAAHWQSRWESLHGDARVEQSDWTWPLRGDWMMRLDEAIGAILDVHGGAAEVALVAHSLGCHLVAAWAAHSSRTAHVRAALLVAPPDVERADMPPQIHSFAPMVRARLPFPALAVLSANDPFCDLAIGRRMAADWGCRSLEPGAFGHLNADSGLGDWPEGRRLLAGLLAQGTEAARGGRALA